MPKKREEASLETKESLYLYHTLTWKSFVSQHLIFGCLNQGDQFNGFHLQTSQHVPQLGHIPNSSETLKQVAPKIGFSHDPVSSCND